MNEREALPRGPDVQAEHQYVVGQGRASFRELLAGYEAASREAEVMPGWTLDVSYGPHPRQVMDFRRTSKPRRATVLYLHAGYWQSRDKATFRFLAPPLNEAGFDVVLANHPLCPDVTVRQIMDAVQALPACVRSSLQMPEDGAPLFAIGHSAGAHLAVHLALRGAASKGGRNRIDGVLGLSGVYDLVPLVATSLNAKLQLDAEQAAQVSLPGRLRGPCGRLPAGVFVVGETETTAFHAQTRAMAEAWAMHGDATSLTAPDDDHFTVLQSLRSPDGLLQRQLNRLCDACEPQSTSFRGR